MRRWVTKTTEYHNLPAGVATERQRQVEKWGIQHHHPSMWLAILMEEVGEWSQAFMDLPMPASKESLEHMRDELVQVAAVALSALSDLDGHYAQVAAKEYPAVEDGFDPARPWDNR